jgi:ArsR family metal-binding transcriptional regulator
MDMYWAHVIQTDLKKYKQKKNNNNEKKDNKKNDDKNDDKNEQYIPKSDCGNCGQNKYFCQCISLKYFNPEKDIY